MHPVLARLGPVVVVAWLSACGGTDPTPDKSPVDRDGDGFSASEDCDDDNDLVHPDAEEICDGVDNDCDATIDGPWAVDATIWYADADGDGFGTARLELRACSAPSGHVDNGDDCDDTDALVSPVADETCDGRDDDCDGTVDESDAVDAQAWYADADGDGHADPAAELVACAAPDGFFSATDLPVDDCNDLDAAVSPSADEVCNEKDDNCDGVVDEDSAVDAPVWYPDTDTDGYGDPLFPAAACVVPDGHVAIAGDCDDASRWVNPEALEVCNGADDDCDGVADGYSDGSAALDAVVWYADDDGDGFADAALTVAAVACDNPGAAVEVAPGDAVDCDDTDADVYPDLDPTDTHFEVCNGKDDDCDGVIDGASAADATLWYRDADSDGFGLATVSVLACTSGVPSGYVANDVDCDDSRSLVNPDGTELCNGLDDDCDASTDEDAVAIDTVEWYPDADADGRGDLTASATLACEQPSGMVASADDCDDAEPLAWSGADELCDDGVDNDCDGATDDAAAVDALAWYTDADNDTYGDPSSVQLACTAPAGTVSNNGDCNDGERLAWSGADEVCGDTVDNDCDGLTDDDSAADAITWYLDGDSDGYGGTTTVVSCTSPSGYAAASGDCNDSDGAINPGASEVCEGSVDENCNGEIDEEDASGGVFWYLDDDSDGFGDPLVSVAGCTAPTGYVSDGTDCNDSDSVINPGADEICDNGLTDEDCDGEIDEGSAVNADPYYTDGDADGYGDPASELFACVQPSGLIVDGSDCDDTRSDVNPAATEICNGLDDDCDANTMEDGLASITADGGTTWFDVTTSLTSFSALGLSSSTFELNLCEGTWYPDISVSSGARVSIQGVGTAANVVLDGTGARQMVEVQGASTVSLSDLSMQRGAASNGGAIACQSSTLTLDRVSVSDSTSTYGGGVYAYDCTLNVTDSDFDGNTAGTDGGAIYGYFSDITLTDTDFTSNQAGSLGGALVGYAAGSTAMVIDGGTLSSNSAAEGAGLYLFQLDAIVGDTVFEDNIATSGGGGVYAYLADLDVDGATFARNEGPAGGAVLYSFASGQLVDSTVEDNTALYGGGLYLQYSSVDLEDSSFDANVATFEGGAIAATVQNQVTCSSSSSTSRSSFTNNEALGSTSAGSVLYMLAFLGDGSIFQAADCDLGTGSLDNPGDDILYRFSSFDTTAEYGDAVTFSCANGLCF